MTVHPYDHNTEGRYAMEGHGLKIAISGKGGVGKSTLAAALSLLAARQGRVLAVDADPDANLAAALGISHDQQAGIIPISQQIDLIEQRTGAKVSQYGQVFKINPDVADVAERFAYEKDNIALLVLGAVKNGGGGCACPESTFIRALVTDLVLFKNQTLVMDMEAGIEHLGRGTARGVDVMIVVVEPGQRSIDCALNVQRMAQQIGVSRIEYIGNKAANAADEEFIQASLPHATLAVIPTSEALRAADRDGVSVLDALQNEPALLQQYEAIWDRLQKGVAHE